MRDCGERFGKFGLPCCIPVVLDRGCEGPSLPPSTAVRRWPIQNVGGTERPRRAMPGCPLNSALTDAISACADVWRLLSIMDLSGILEDDAACRARSDIADPTARSPPPSAQTPKPTRVICIPVQPSCISVAHWRAACRGPSRSDRPRRLACWPRRESVHAGIRKPSRPRLLTFDRPSPSSAGSVGAVCNRTNRASDRRPPMRWADRTPVHRRCTLARFGGAIRRATPAGVITSKSGCNARVAGEPVHAGRPEQEGRACAQVRPE
jgi:hypothetical protein